MLEVCIDEVRKPLSAFSDSQKKTGQNYFAEDPLYQLVTKASGYSSDLGIYGWLYMYLCTMG